MSWWKTAPVVVAAAVMAGGCSASGDSPAEPGGASAAAPALSDCVRDGQGFTGGATVPRQIYGSYGPGKSQVWDVDKGATAGGTQNVNMATGFPNSVVTILWGKGAKAGEDVMTVECTSGWDTYDDSDPTKLWHAGIIFDEIPGLGSNTYFCHDIEMDTSGDRTVMKMWETYWAYGEDYTCPDTLKAAMAGEIDFPNPVTYLELPDTGIGAATVAPQDWTTEGTQVGIRVK